MSLVCITASGPAFGQSSGVGTGISRIAEDTYFETEIGFELGYREWELAIEIPLRFRLKDLAPPSTSVIREFDYDEVGDYLGWIRYIRYGRTRFWGLAANPYYANFGELSRVHMGHGSIVSGYDNIIGFNHKQWGIHLRTNQDIATVDFMLDDIVDPGVIGTRVTIRPGEIFTRRTEYEEVLPAEFYEPGPSQIGPNDVRPQYPRERAPEADGAGTHREGEEPGGSGRARRRGGDDEDVPFDNWVEIDPSEVIPTEVTAQPVEDDPTFVRIDDPTLERQDDRAHDGADAGAQANAADDQDTAQDGEPGSRTPRNIRASRPRGPDGAVWVGDPQNLESSQESADDGPGVAAADDPEFEHPYPWQGLEFGVTFVGDADAPYRLRGDEDAEAYEVDSRSNILVAEHRPTAFVGFDAQVDAFRNETVSVIPYTDVNTHLSRGRGVHFGTFVNFRTPRDVRVNSRLEMRAASRGYEPVYFDTSYEARRTAYLPIDGILAQPKLRVMDLDPPPGRVGWYTDASVAIRDRVRLSAGLGDYQGPSNSLIFLSLTLRDMGPFDIRFRLSNRDFSGAAGLFEPEHLQVTTSLQWSFLRYFFVKARYVRDYDLDGRGRYRPDNNWAFGVGLVLPI